MKDRWNGDPNNPTIQEIMDAINPGYFKLHFANGTPRSLRTHLGKKAIAFWHERFSAVFVIRNGANKLNFYSAVNSAPLCSEHLPIASDTQSTSIISMKPDIALSFLENVNGKCYHELRFELFEQVGEYLGNVHVTKNVPLSKYVGSYPDNKCCFIGRETQHIISLYVYEKQGELIVKTASYGEVGIHSRKPAADSKRMWSKAWADHNIAIGTRQQNITQERPGIPQKELHYLWKVTTTLPDEIYKKLIGLQTMEKL